MSARNIYNFIILFWSAKGNLHKKTIINIKEFSFTKWPICFPNYPTLIPKIYVTLLILIRLVIDSPWLEGKDNLHLHQFIFKKFFLVSFPQLS
jgi:hypothetical protein